MSNNKNDAKGKSTYLQTNFKKLIFPLFFLMAFFCYTRAQVNMDSVKDNWETRLGVLMVVDWNDNVYKLSSSQQTRMNLDDPGDITSGRYNNMESISDVILSIAPEFEVRTKNGLFRRSFSLAGIIDYQQYINNPEKSHFNLVISVKQKVSKHGKFIFRALYIPSYFKKNYLLDATDSTGHVSSSERIYYEGVYNELEFILSYHHKFLKWIVDVKSDLFFGYRNRNYNSQFPGRNQDVFAGGLAFEILPAKWWSVYLGYMIESGMSPITPEVMILDEPDYQIDFNNDRDFADNNRRTVQTVNRSDYAQSLEFGLKVRPLKQIKIYAGYGFVFTDYLSQEPIDPNYKNRNDTKTTLQLGVDYKIFKGFSIIAVYKNITQLTNRPEDPGHVGEETDYNNNIIKAGIQWRFFEFL
jgi:hypothetical protein